MQVFFWCILGLLAGGMVAGIVKDTKKFVVFLDLLLGVLGAVTGGIITNVFTLQNVMGLYDETILLVVAGAGILIWVGRTLIVKNSLEE